MVFIVLAAAKAAKSARDSHVKNKKRNEMITPVEGSLETMEDRAATGASVAGAGIDTWYGAPRACAVSVPEAETINTGSRISAWGRNTLSEAESNPSHRRSASHSSVSDHGSQVLTGVMCTSPSPSQETVPVVKDILVEDSVEELEKDKSEEPPIEEKDSRCDEREKVGSAEMHARKARTKAGPSKPTKPKPVEGSFEEAVCGGRKKQSPRGGGDDGPEVASVQCERTGDSTIVTNDAQKSKVGARVQSRQKKVKSEVQEDGSFEAALKKGIPNRTSAVSVGVASKEGAPQASENVGDGCFQSAMQKGGSLRKVRGKTAVLAATEVESGVETAEGGEFAMQKHGALPRKTAASNRTEPVPQEAVSAMAYPTGSKLRRPARGGLSAPPAGNAAKGADEEVGATTEKVVTTQANTEAAVTVGESCMRAEGSMKRRLNRRQ